MEINIKTPQTEFHNIIDGPAGLQVRNGFVTSLRYEDIAGTFNASKQRTGNGSSTKIIYGFSAESANNGRTYHYIFSQDVNNNLIGSVFDSQFYCLSSITYGKMTNDPEPFSVAINYNQIIVNSPSMPYPLWGFIGGSLVRANKIESINPDTPALTLFPGRVCSFADRFAWAYANQVIFNDPGTEPRTITAPNAISFGGTVLDIFQAGQGGNLIIICTDATYSIPPDGLNGFQFQGVISRIPGYQGARSNNAATARGTTLGLIKDGVIDIGSFQKRQLSKYRIRRYLSEQVGPDESGDYRNGTILATDQGFMVTINNKTCFIDIDSGLATWLYPTLNSGWIIDNKADFKVVGILKDTDGKNIFITTTSVIELLGNTDYYDTPTSGTPSPVAVTSILSSLLTKISTDPQLSPVIREITTSADRPGYSQASYIRGSYGTEVTPAPQNSSIINVSLWSNSRQLIEKEMRSRDVRRAIRGDSPDLEVSYTGGATRVGEVVDVIAKGVGRNRPTQ
jgi:hypothetical protein